MQLVPTMSPRAKQIGGKIHVEIQDNFSIVMSPFDALSFAMTTLQEARHLIDQSRQLEPKDAQVIAFPVHATRRA